MDNKVNPPVNNQITNNKPQYAGFMKRYLAKMSDTLIIICASLLFLSLLGLGHQNLRSLFILSGWYFLFFIIIIPLLLPLLYYSYMTYRFGGSIGKLIAGLSVVDENGKKLTFGKSLFRHYIGYNVSALLFGLGYFWVIKDPKKQGWHDQLSGSYVVIKKASGAVLSVIFVIFMLIVNSFLIFSLIGQLVKNQSFKNDLLHIRELYLNRNNIPRNFDQEIDNLNNETKDLFPEKIPNLLQD